MREGLKQKFFALLQAGMGLPCSTISLTNEELEEILTVSKRHSVVQIIYRGLRDVVALEKDFSKFDKIRIKSIHDAIVLDNQTKVFSRILDELHIPHVLLKGAVLKHLYPDPTLRTCGDIDILVSEANIHSAVSAIEEATDFKCGERSFHDITMSNGHILLELHFSIKENMPNIDPLLDKVWDYARAPERGYSFVLSPEYLLFYTLAHMSYHISHGGLGIRPFLDLWLLKTKTTFDESELKNMLSESGLQVFYEKCFNMVDSWMRGMPVIDELKPLEEYCLAGGVYGSSRNVALAESRNRGKIRYLSGRVFVSRSYLEGLFPGLKTKPLLMPIYQVRRWFRLSNKVSRKRVKNEFVTAMQSSSEDKDYLDSILKGLGL